MLIGAHVSPSGGPAKAVERGTERGCHSIQIFNQNPRQWAARDYSQDEIDDFHVAMEASDVDALLIHAVYLLNPASEERDFREKTLGVLTTSLRMGAALGAVGVVLHPGSALKTEVGPALERASEVIKEALAESAECPLHLEDTAGAGGTLDRLVEELARPIEPRRRRVAARGVPGLLPSLRVGVRHPRRRAPGRRVGRFRLRDRDAGRRPAGAASSTTADQAWGFNRERRQVPGRRDRPSGPALGREPRFEGLPCVLEGPGAKGKALDADDVAWQLERQQGPGAADNLVMEQLTRRARRQRPSRWRAAEEEGGGQQVAAGVGCSSLLS